MFEAYGNAGNLQASDEVKNFVLIQKGVLNNQFLPTFTPNSIICNSSTTIQGYAPKNPIIAFRSGNKGGSCRGVTQSGSGATKQFIFQAWVQSTSPPPAANTNFCDYYIFDEQPNDPFGGGLVTYMSDGTVAFNSNYKPMIIGGVAQCATQTVVASPFLRASISGLSSSRIWAGAVTLSAFWVRTDLTINEAFGFCDCVTTTSTSVTDTIDLVLQFGGRASINTAPFIGGQLIAIDVTGL
jgi:hypothetical protein